MRPTLLHGQQSSSFLPPPENQPLSVPEMYEWNQQNSGHHTLFSYEESTGHTRVITWAEAVQGIQRASRFITSRASFESQSTKGDISGPPRIAILASLGELLFKTFQSFRSTYICSTSDTITYFCLLVGILRAGWTVVPIYARNTPEEVAKLLAHSHVHHIIATSDIPVQNLADNVVRLSEPITLEHVHIHAAPSFEDLFPQGGFDPSFVADAISPIDLDAPAAILHSSGQ